MAVPKVIRRQVKRVRAFVKEFFLEFLVDVFHFLVHGTTNYLYEKTLPFTTKYLSRVPKPPNVTVKDVRANRIRLNIDSSYSSPFNIEQFEIEWTSADSDIWVNIGTNDLQQRTVARLKPDSEYKFRVRAHNQKGMSGWSSVVNARTKIDPKNGGGYGDRFVWEQTPTDVTISFEMPPNTTKRDVRLTLRSDYIRVEVVHSGGTMSKLMLEGELYGKVKSFDNGSFWEVVKENGKLMLNLTLEKQTKSLAPKFDYWRAIIPGQHEIDTHKITSEEAGTGLQMLHPGQYDPDQLRNMGLKGF